MGGRDVFECVALITTNNALYNLGLPLVRRNWKYCAVVVFCDLIQYLRDPRLVKEAGVFLPKEDSFPLITFAQCSEAELYRVEFFDLYFTVQPRL